MPRMGYFSGVYEDAPWKVLSPQGDLLTDLALQGLDMSEARGRSGAAASRAGPMEGNGNTGRLW